MRWSARRRYREYSPRRKSPVGGIISLIFLLLIGAVAFRGFLFYKDSRLGKFDRFNVVLIAKPLTLLSLNLRDQTAVAVAIPDDLYIPDLAHGYGAYRAGMMYSVGQLDHRGGETVAATVADYLGVPVDGYIYSPKDLATDVKKYFLSPNSVLAGKSDLNFLDRFQLAWTVMQIRFDKIKAENLSQFTEPLLLADGSTAMSLDKESVDSHLQGDFTENRIRDENYRMEIVNTTPVVGLGNRASRILVNVGANVVNVGTMDIPSTDCQIKATDKAKNSVTVSRTKAIFNCQISSLPDEGRAEIEVILGQDYAQKLGK